MEKIKFSIIIPVFNNEKFIRGCLESIISQTYKNLEIIVVDDCSTDDTKKVLQEYDCIKILSTKENSRQGAARNIGLDNCSGDYILFVDSDDSLYDENVIEKIADKILNTDFPDLIYLGMKIIGKRQMEIIPNEENSKKEYRLSENPFINVNTICWKRDLIENNNIRFPERIRYEDVYFAFLAIEKSEKYEHMDIIYYLYNNREDSSTTNYSLEQVKDTIKLIEKLFELYDKIDKSNFEFLSKRIIQQEQRANVRLERAIKDKLNKI